MTVELSASTLGIPERPEITGLSPVLSYVVRTYQISQRIVGEERNIARLFASIETRHLSKEHRRHFLAQSELGMGKTTLVRRVLRPVWSDVETYSRMTGAGLDRRQESFDGKILLLEQLTPDQPLQLAFLMTEGELTILVSEMDPESKRFVSTRHMLKGMPVVVSTLTGAVIDPQHLSRFDTARIDESEDQTERITSQQLHEAAYPRFEDPEFLYGPITWMDAKCRELGPRVRQVVIPYAEKLKIPREFSAMRRKLPQILALVQGVAFVKAALGLRPRVEVKVSKTVELEPQTFIVADPEDLSDAVFCLGGHELEESAAYFYGRCQDVYVFISTQPGPENSLDYHTSTSVARGLRMGQRTARDYLNALCDLGQATRDKVKGEWRYRPVEQTRPQIGLNVTFSQEELEAWFEKAFPNGGAAKLLLPGLDVPSVVSVSAAPPEPVTSRNMQNVTGHAAVHQTADDPATVVVNVHDSMGNRVGGNGVSKEGPLVVDVGTCSLCGRNEPRVVSPLDRTSLVCEECCRTRCQPKVTVNE